MKPLAPLNLLSTMHSLALPMRIANCQFSTSSVMSEEEVEAAIMNICREFDKINASKIVRESHFMNDLGLDSLDHVEIIMAIEDEFGFEIPDVEAEKLLRPIDIVKHVHGKLLADAAPTEYPR